ncbi:phosphate ABC transporter substrate-binding protein PstS [Arenimonas sp. GDDSR-1]|uniref:phosphate ABC transporter substrate-binding protein PstS n=1 Tax=Arenimonas sp. GDDSR-1 TaxID=2950125 RepID=UPI002621A1C1|nr:phosphate ABC transporter substrate-binding protein PstS [Arenimonas sp. GDDSR-1]
MFNSLKTPILALALASAGMVANAAEITGAGASFVFPVMSKWSADYNKATKNKVNYQSIGSGGGIAQIKAATVDFGSSDAPLKPGDLAASGLAQFPSVMGAVVPIVNIPGLKQGQVKLTGPIIADIFLGKITHWNDPVIAAVNPGVTFPAQKITVVHRSDGSGTTFNFVNYLSKVSLDWRNKVGEGTAVKWPTGVGGKGNEGVAAYTKQIKGAIGYVELSYAITNKLNYTAVRNRAGNFIVPSKDSIKAAAASAEWGDVKDFSLVITDAPGAQAYPISATNFILMYKIPKKPQRSKEALAFFDWVYKNGDASAEALGYVALPAELTQQIKAYWAANIK